MKRIVFIGILSVCISIGKAEQRFFPANSVRCINAMIFDRVEDEEGNMTITITLPEAESFLDMSYIAVRSALNGTRKYNKGEDTKGDYIEIGVAKFYKE